MQVIFHSNWSARFSEQLPTKSVRTKPVSQSVTQDRFPKNWHRSVNSSSQLITKILIFKMAVFRSTVKDQTCFINAFLLASYILCFSNLLSLSSGVSFARRSRTRSRSFSLICRLVILFFGGILLAHSLPVYVLFPRKCFLNNKQWFFL